MAAPLTVTLDDVSHLIDGGIVSQPHYLKAIAFLRDGAFWKRWAIRALFALAIGHILSGVIFFFAFNWNDLAGMTKFAIVGGGIFASLAAWVITKLDSPVGQAFGIAATVLVGVMFAVLGQVYQTPAMIHTPFVFWAILTLLFALASQNLTHWTVWLTILVVAISTYANSGLRLGGNNLGANILNIAVSAGFIGALILRDKVLASRMAWTRAEWFRVLLVLGAVGFAFIGFTESFWGNSNGWFLWIIAIALIGGLISYLYFKAPSLATLSLATFGGFTLVAQFGFKIFEVGKGEVGIFFLIFVWLGGLTVAMVALFRHYIKRQKTVDPHIENEIPEDNAQGVSLEKFSNHLELEAGSVSGFMEGADTNPPWYMSVFLAVAGVLTAILGSLFFGSFIALTLNNAEEIVFGILGLIIFAVAIFLRRKTDSEYVQHLLNTMIVIGGIMTAFGFGIEIDNFDGVVFLMIILSVIVLVLVKDRILEFLSAAAIITLIGMELYHLKVPMVESFILIIATLAGVVLLTRPIRKRLFNSAATAFLIAPGILGIALVHGHRWDRLADATRFSDDWAARIISLVILLGAVAYLNRGLAFKDFKPPILVLIPLVIGAAFVPLGGGSALLLMLAGYILGSRSLAMIGTLLQIYFLTMFYYDLSLDLLTKSIILFVTGLIFLGVWFFVERRERVIS